MKNTIFSLRSQNMNLDQERDIAEKITTMFCFNNPGDSITIGCESPDSYYIEVSSQNSGFITEISCYLSTLGL
jgi:hypothetical protein